MISTLIAAVLMLSVDNTTIVKNLSVNQKPTISQVETKSKEATPVTNASPNAKKPASPSASKLPEAIQKLKPHIGKTKFCSKCKHDVPSSTTLNEKQREYVYSLATWLEKGEKARPGNTTSRSYVRGLTRLSYIESTHSTVKKNKTSSASGLFGFLNSTWKGTKIPKTTCPVCQTRAAIRYCLKRYGSVEGALRHHHKTARKIVNGKPVGGWY